jgi:hypothetical protein
MANTNVEIQKIIFDTSNPEITKVTVEIEHDSPSDLFMKCRYEKSFPASIPVVDLLQKAYVHGRRPLSFMVKNGR